MAVCGRTRVAGGESENFCEWMLWLCLIFHVRESLCSEFEFFEQITAERRVGRNWKFGVQGHRMEIY